MESIKVTTSNEHIGKRLDIVLANILPVVTGKLISRTQIQNCIKSGNVLVNNLCILNSNTKLNDICNIQVNIRNNNNEYEITGENIPLEIVYEDDYILVINKPAGLVCHPAVGHKSGTLVNALVNRFKLSNINGSDRPGIIHRLDKDTSGLMIVAKTNEAHIAFSNLFANAKGTLIKRKYTAVVFNTPQSNQGATNITRNEMRAIRTYITRHPKNRQMFTTSDNKGKLAITLYKVQKSYYFSSTKSISLIECELLTGRTHQIRVHMKYIGCPVVGDKMYGKTKIEPIYPEYIREFPRQALHSSALYFVHPFTKNELKFTSLIPRDMLEIIEHI